MKQWEHAMKLQLVWNTENIVWNWIMVWNASYAWSWCLWYEINMMVWNTNNLVWDKLWPGMKKKKEWNAVFHQICTFSYLSYSNLVWKFRLFSLMFYWFNQSKLLGKGGCVVWVGITSFNIYIHVKNSSKINKIYDGFKITGKLFLDLFWFFDLFTWE